MMRSLLGLAALALVSGCVTRPSAPPTYRATGTEPFWSLVIDPHNMTFTAAGAQPISQSTPDMIVGVAGEIYQSPRINVNIVHTECSDGMSNRSYIDTVQVTVDGRQYKGCGGL